MRRLVSESIRNSASSSAAARRPHSATDPRHSDLTGRKKAPRSAVNSRVDDEDWARIAHARKKAQKKVVEVPMVDLSWQNTG